MTNPLLNLILTRLLKEEVTIQCQTCNETFYLGTAENYTEHMQQNPPPPFHINAIRHAWNNPDHNVITTSPTNKLLAAQLHASANITQIVQTVKQANPEKADKPFETLRHSFQDAKTGEVKPL